MYNPLLAPAAADPVGPTVARSRALVHTAPPSVPASTPLAAPTSIASPDHLIDLYAAKYGVNPAVAKAQMMAESGGDQGAVSGVGALGRFQLMPETARELGVDPNNPVQNIEGGVRYLAQQLHRFGGDYGKALAAYNAGPGAVEHYGGIPPFAETQAYVQKILHSAGQYVHGLPTFLGSIAHDLNQPIMARADAAELPHAQQDPVLAGLHPTGAHLQAAATEYALGGTSTTDPILAGLHGGTAAPQDASPAPAAFGPHLDVLGALRHLGGGAAHVLQDVAQGTTNLEQSIGLAPMLHKIAGDAPGAWHPSVTENTDNVTDRALAALQVTAQQAGHVNPTLAQRLFDPNDDPIRKLLLGHAAVQAPNLQPVTDPENKVAMSALASGSPLMQDQNAMPNFLRRTALQTAADPVTWATLGAGRLATAGLQAADPVLQGLTHALEPALNAAKATKAGQVAGDVGKGFQDFFSVNAPLRRDYGDARTAIFQQMQQRNENLARLEGVAHNQTIEALRPDLDAAQAAHNADLQYTRNLPSAHNIALADVQQPIINLPGPVQAMLDRDAWLNGTKQVRSKMVGLGYAPTDDIKDAPLLNILTDYRKGYQPLKDVMSDDSRLKGLYDDTLGMQQRNPLGFNLAQTGDDAKSPLADRIMYRLMQGRNMRAAVLTKRDILNDVGALDRVNGGGLNGTLLNAQGKLSGSVDQDALNSYGNAVSNHHAAIRSMTAQPQLDLVTAHDPFLGYVDPSENPIFHPPYNALDAQTQHQLAQQYEREQATFHMPASVKQFLYANGSDKPSLMAKFADLRREALFALPFGHMKNVGALQAEGPGGAEALMRGIGYSNEGPQDSVLSAMREHTLAERGALGLQGHGEAKTWIGKVPILKDLYHAGNDALGSFDTNQRFALHETLLKNDPAYAAMSPLEQGAKINDVLFNYSQASPMAQALRQWGSGFPAWRLGNVALQARRVQENPAKMMMLQRGEQLGERAIDPNQTDPTGWSPRLNTPLDEAIKFAMLDPHWFASTAGPVIGGGVEGVANAFGGPQSALDLGKAGKAAYGAATQMIPGGSEIADTFDASPFKSTAPGPLRALLDLGGISTKTNATAYSNALINLIAMGMTEQQAKNLLRHAPSTYRGGRH